MLERKESITALWVVLWKLLFPRSHRHPLFSSHHFLGYVIIGQKMVVFPFAHCWSTFYVIYWEFVRRAREFFATAVDLTSLFIFFYRFFRWKLYNVCIVRTNTCSGFFHNRLFYIRWVKEFTRVKTTSGSFDVPDYCTAGLPSLLQV